MTRRPLILLGLTALLSVACVRTRVITAGDVAAPSVRTTESVYLGNFGLTADGLHARSALRAEIERRGLFTVVDNEEEADARIEGRVALWQSASARTRRIRVAGEALLMDRRSGRLVWRHNYVERDPQGITPHMTPDLMIQRLVSQFCDELELSAARDAERVR